jgi:hypothetical protein
MTVADPFASILKSICSSSRVETEWLALLSQLEYVGCRKILKAVPMAAMTGEVLRHVHEESLHAYLLRRLVEDRNPRHPVVGAFGDLGWEYFRSLDEGVSHIDPVGAYPRVSWAIEKRALYVYPLYRQATGSAAIRKALDTILTQEKNHLDKFESAASTADVAELEHGLWMRFTTRLADRVCMFSTAPARALPSLLPHVPATQISGEIS